MNKKLQKIETPYVDAQTLLTLFADYKKPRECILRLIKKEELMRLKNGYYLILEKINLNEGAPFEQIANWLYGPSYVSLEWALSFYGMIPERVHTITSMTLGRNKEYRTPIGDFAYHRLSPRQYFYGVTLKETPGFVGGFLMATPEKALADLVFKTCKGLNKQQLRIELLESKRIEPESFNQLNKALLIEISHYYRAKSVDTLTDLVGSL